MRFIPTEMGFILSLDDNMYPTVVSKKKGYILPLDAKKYRWKRNIFRHLMTKSILVSLPTMGYFLLPNNKKILIRVRVYLTRIRLAKIVRRSRAAQQHASQLPLLAQPRGAPTGRFHRNCRRWPPRWQRLNGPHTSRTQLSSQFTNCSNY